MTDSEAQQRFVFMRSQNWSFNRIAVELQISKPTLIKWSRKFQYEIRNVRATELEALKEKWLHSRDVRINKLGEELQRIEAEIAKRDLATIPTARLYIIAESLRRQICHEADEVEFTTPLSEIPPAEQEEQVHDWKA